MTRASSALVLALAAGCVTATQFTPVGDFPPSIEPVGGAQYRPEVINRLEPAGDAGVPGTVTLSVIVRDPDVRSTLSAHVYIDYVDSMSPPIWNIQIPPTRDNEVARRADALIPTSAFSRNQCHRVDFVVSSAFTTQSSRQPVTANDVATLVYWFIVGNVGIEECLGRGP